MRCLVFIAPGDFHDETLSTVKLFFAKWGIEPVMTSYTSHECTGSHGSVCRPDINTSNVTVFGYDALLLIDGKGIDTYKVYDYRPLLDMVFSFYKNGRQVCAIGNSIKALARANIIKNKRVAAWDDAPTKGLVLLFHGLPSQKAIEVEDNLCTISDLSALETAMPQWISHLGVK